MAKSIEERYENLTREEIIERCEAYRRQIGGMSKRPNMLKQELNDVRKENSFLRKTLSNLFDEYVTSHTWIDSDKNAEISPLERSVLKQFEAILDSRGIKHVDVPPSIQ